jgi:hypothetical protein
MAACGAPRARSRCPLRPVARRRETDLDGSGHTNTTDGSCAPNPPQSARVVSAVPGIAPDDHRHKVTDAAPASALRTAAAHSRRWLQPDGARGAAHSRWPPDRCRRSFAGGRKCGPADDSVPAQFPDGLQQPSATSCCALRSAAGLGKDSVTLLPATLRVGRTEDRGRDRSAWRNGRTV